MLSSISLNNIFNTTLTVITSDFEAELKIDLRLLAAAGNLMVGDTKSASANLNSYSSETKRGYNISYDALAIPLTSLGKTISGEVKVSDALIATKKNYQNLYQLAYNQNITLTDLAGDGKLITYNGNQLDNNAQTRYAEGFYDRESDTLAINSDSNQKDNQLAGTISHEAAHRMFNKEYHQSYTQSEEHAAHMIGDFTESRWDTYQSGNTSLRASLPTSTFNYSNNFYANNVKFGDEVNPLFPVVVPVLATGILTYVGDGDALKGSEIVNGKIANSLLGQAAAWTTNKVIDGADVFSNLTGLTQDGATPTRDGIAKATNAYQTYLPKELQQAFGLAGLTTGAMQLGKAGAWALDVNPNTATNLYRAVGPEELLDIKNTNTIRNLGSAEGKYFTDSAQYASSYAKQAVKSFGDEPYTIIKTQISTKSLNDISSIKVDGGIPAWVIPESQLQNMKPKILNFSPLPNK